MTETDPVVGGSTGEDAALRAILEGTAGATGERFFARLVQSLARGLGMTGAWVTEYQEAAGRLRAIAFWLGDRWVAGYEYDVAGTPCEPVVRDLRLVHVPDRVIELYPRDPDLKQLGAVSYLGVPLLGLDGKVLGHLAVLDEKPMPENPRCMALFQIFAARAASELRRLRAESEVRERDERIRSLAGETEYLREEVRELQGFGEILGRSEAMNRMMGEIEQVARTDATVLILGETGTGKELVARAIHAAGPRRQRPFITVNCGALPDTLIESELFGHERGAFTGATQRRDGRFALADGGTIFLDEIGELPLPLQVKLLRVLQEGEFERVGSSRTTKVDARVIAATNRDLRRAVESGEFRGDLYFRIHVFPIHVPPLRERGDDVVLLAEAFARRCGRRIGRRIEPFSGDAVRSLKAYDWPGNVRELQNVVERAVITSRDGRLILSRALPESARPPGEESPPIIASLATPDAEAPAVLTDSDVRNLERRNILLALESAGWRVSGPRGAARLLEISPSTLASRMKALGIRRSPGS